MVRFAKWYVMTAQYEIERAQDGLGDRSGPHLVERIAFGLSDLWQGARQWPLWTMLAWTDIRQRYRRSVLGPFWITISMALFIVLLGGIYSRLFNMDIAVYLPYVAIGLIVWGFISGTTIESSNSFIDNAGLIKQIRLAYSIYVLRTVWRAFIILLHTIVLIVPITIIFNVPVTPATLLFVPGLALIFLNQVWLSITIAILSTRFRDIPQLIATAVQITMFATPIMWPVTSLGGSTLIADINPVYHLIEIVRAPLLGQMPHLLSWAVVIGLSVLGFLLAAFLLHRSSRRIVYWL